MRAIRYLHSRGIIHGHISPQVIWVDGDKLTLAGVEHRHRRSPDRRSPDRRSDRAADFADGARALLSEAGEGVAEATSRTTGLLKQIIAEADALDLDGVEAIVAAL